VGTQTEDGVGDNTDHGQFKIKVSSRARDETRDPDEVKCTNYYEIRSATFHGIAGRARAWSSCRVKLIEPPFDELFILLARNDIIYWGASSSRKCHRGRGTRPAIPLKWNRIRATFHEIAGRARAWSWFRVN